MPYTEKGSLMGTLNQEEEEREPLMKVEGELKV